MSILMFGLFIAAALALAIIPLGLRLGSPILRKNVRLVRTCLLAIAGAFSALLSLICLAAAAWGMNTSLPWGIDVLMYLIPALSLPAFLILKLGSVRLLSFVLWILAVSSSFAFYFGDKADRFASGFRPITDPQERIGTFLNAFTLILLGIAVLVQVASICASWEKRMVKPSETDNEPPILPP